MSDRRILRLRSLLRGMRRYSRVWGSNWREALEPIWLGAKDYFGIAWENIPERLCLRLNHGFRYMTHDFQKEIKWPRIKLSLVFVCMPECNVCAERFFQTQKKTCSGWEIFKNRRTAVGGPWAPQNLKWKMNYAQTPVQNARAVQKGYYRQSRNARINNNAIWQL